MRAKVSWLGALKIWESLTLPRVAMFSEWAVELTGFIAWLGLWQFHLIKRLATWNTVTVLVLSILTFAVTARTANLGGDIRHPEILSEQQSATDDGAGVPDIARSIADFVTGHAWVWPTLETLHFVGLCMLFAVVLMVDLRLLGMAKKFSFAGLYQLLPIGMLGFGINLVTGMFAPGAEGHRTRRLSPSPERR